MIILTYYILTCFYEEGGGLMKRKISFCFIFFIVAFSMTFYANDNNAAVISADEIEVTLHVEGNEIPAIIYNTTAGQTLLGCLPHTVHLSKGSIDFCGDIGIDIQYETEDLQDGIKEGDLTYWLPGSDFVIFLVSMPSNGNHSNPSNVGLGRILNVEDIDFLKNYSGYTAEIEITLAE
jgi:hypothetical protein